MPRWVKITLGVFLTLVFLFGGFLSFFIYKVKYGIPKYETEKPILSIPEDEPAILLFSKTTGFRHGHSIEATKAMMSKMAEQNDWFLYNTEDAGIINSEQLPQFDVIIWSNSTGICLTEEQRLIVQNYVESGGGMIGIHGAGDDSHNWDWYEQNVLGARFSHHPIKNHLQETKVSLAPFQDSTLWQNLPQEWMHTDEWYVFFQNPRENGFRVLYSIDGEAIDPNGNILWVNNKNFGMGKDHPIAWFKEIKQGRTFYTSAGHTGEAFAEKELVQLIKNAIRWAGRLE